MCTCVFGQFEPDKNTFFFFRKKKEKKGKKKMEEKLSPPMARLIFRAVLARTKSRGVSQQVRLYEFVQSNKVCLARDTYDPPFSSSATKQWNIHRINMYTHTRQNFKNRSVFFFFFALPTRWKYYSPYFFFFFPSFSFPLKFVLQSISFQREEKNLSSIEGCVRVSRGEDDTLREVGSINKR